jgi:16S rRNA (cytosine967-C5)-methyltransferase
LSEGIDRQAFTLSHFQQPDLFLRIRPGHERTVKDKLISAGIQFSVISDHCTAIPNSTKVDTILDINKEAVIQDMNSQNTGKLIQSAIANLKSKIHIWDSCAASGGKSIMAYDINPEIKLTVSDVRESILANLEKRFREAGLRKFKSFVADLTSDAELPVSPGEFDLIIADVPCSGSGTWSRTPEQLYYFDEKKIDAYSALQKKIISVLIPYLKAGGHLLYITCSVFKKENEDIVSFIKEQSGLNPVKTELLKGYGEKADTLFACLLKNPLLQH